METYNVYIDSNQASIQNTNNISNQYQVNWASIMPEGSYNLTFSFLSTSSSTVNGTQIASVFCNLGGNNQYKGGGLSVQAIGFLAPFYLTTTSAYWYSDTNTNPPIYLQQRPNQQQLIISVCSGLDTTANINIVEYCMVLHFERIS